MREYEAKFLKHRREVKGLSRYYLAKQLGISAQFYGKIEKGQASLPSIYVKKFLLLTSKDSKNKLKSVSFDIHYYIEAMLNDYQNSLESELGV